MGADVRKVRTLLARAFHDDPLMEWVFPDAATRPDAVAAWLGLFVEHDQAVGEVEVLRGEGPGAPVQAVAVWRPSTGAPATGTLPTIGGLLTLLIGPERTVEVAHGLRAIHELAPTQPHTYLHFLAVDPELQGRGLGRRVMARGLRRSLDAGTGVHLETTNPRALTFYHRLGFQITGQRQVNAPGRPGPTMWAMWARPPRQHRDG
ncbi:GNAT family N-acetyltransferase [Cellulomonas bogoriensis]|uniref:Acetyltransferase n=1 Tax=Cellulomonas bogoriensis 69B4 = DSM 16987 TaxID=1386082 RepID=A0A0A0BNA0_9CELL|nr:N-acetyltransferase [Cellulomonas bogoriensis]KGM09441.1 acetyltransferase [Cellulomonas bogoriensis 69B4 = DSM 16987]